MSSRRSGDNCVCDIDREKRGPPREGRLATHEMRCAQGHRLAAVVFLSATIKGRAKPVQTRKLRNMIKQHSLWLMPCASDLAFLQSIVDRLAVTYGTKVFCPHLTLQEDMPISATGLAEVVEQNFAGHAAFSSPISRVAGLPLFYRSLFAQFEPSDRLLGMKTIAVTCLSKGDVESFLPHISLAYGVAEDRKASAIAALNGELEGRVVHFDTIAVAASSQEIPIEEWAVVHRHLLR